MEKQHFVKNSSKTMPERPGTPLERCALKNGAYSFQNYRLTTFMIPVAAGSGAPLRGAPDPAASRTNRKYEI